MRSLPLLAILAAIAIWLPSPATADTSTPPVGLGKRVKLEASQEKRAEAPLKRPKRRSHLPDREDDGYEILRPTF
jgi:hypothetical protein